MNTKDKINYISDWIKTYAKTNNFKSLVIGISGGIDSAVTSTLSAKTGLKTIVGQHLHGWKARTDGRPRRVSRSSSPRSHL